MSMNMNGLGRVSKVERKTSGGGKDYLRIRVGCPMRRRVDGTFKTVYENGELLCFNGIDFLFKLQEGDRVYFTGEPELRHWTGNNGDVHVEFRVAFANVAPAADISKRDSGGDYGPPPSGGGGGGFGDDSIPFAPLDERLY